MLGCEAKILQVLKIMDERYPGDDRALAKGYRRVIEG